MVHQNDNARGVGRYLAWLFCGVALSAIVFYGVNRYSHPLIVAQTTPGTAQVPRVVQVPQATADGPVNPASQVSPQGPTGPLDTKSSGGAPASSPQGETAPGMQSAPQGSAEKAQSPPK